MGDSFKKVVLFIIGCIVFGIAIMVGIDYYNENTESAIKLRELREISFSEHSKNMKHSDSVYNEVAKQIYGNWEESKTGIYTRYQFYRMGSDVYVFMKMQDSSETVEKLIEIKKDDGTEYHYKDGGYAGEYFKINNENELLFINKSGRIFSKGTAL